MWLYFMRVSPMTMTSRTPLTAETADDLNDHSAHCARMASPRFIPGCEATPDLRQAFADPQFQRRWLADTSTCLAIAGKAPMSRWLHPML